MGAERNDPVPVLPQLSLAVTPTQTVYKFAGEGVEVSLTFTSPLLPHDLNVLSWPVTYLTWTARSVDGKEPRRATLLRCVVGHRSEYFRSAGELVATPDQWIASAANGLARTADAAKVGRQSSH